MTVTFWSTLRAITISAAMVTCALMAGRPACAASSPPNAAAVNRGVVQLVTGRSMDISVQMAEEMAGIVDDGATRRIVPVVGKGPLQNLTDLKYLRGIDLAIVPEDALDHVRAQRLLPGIDVSLTYVAKLYNQEFHLLARSNIEKIADLSGQTVNVDVQDSSTALTATRLFDRLNIRVKVANDSPQVALQKLRNGEIAALALVAAKPSPFFQDLDTKDDLHLLGVPLTGTTTSTYIPTRITSADYPGLLTADQSVDTIAVGSVLMAADLRNLSERYRNLANFIDALFTGFSGLLQPGHHPKWQEVNVAADFPGWTRHPAAQQWLHRNAQVATAPTSESMQTLFSRYIDERRQASGGTPMSSAEKDALFQQFRAWQRGQAR